MDVATSRADFARHVDAVFSLELVVKKAEEKVVAKVTGLKATVATARDDLDIRVEEVRELVAVLEEKYESAQEIGTNAVP